MTCGIISAVITNEVHITTNALNLQLLIPLLWYLVSHLNHEKNYFIWALQFNDIIFVLEQSFSGDILDINRMRVCTHILPLTPVNGALEWTKV